MEHSWPRGTYRRHSSLSVCLPPSFSVPVSACPPLSVPGSGCLYPSPSVSIPARLRPRPSPSPSVSVSVRLRPRPSPSPLVVCGCIIVVCMGGGVGRGVYWRPSVPCGLDGRTIACLGSMDRLDSRRRATGAGGRVSGQREHGAAEERHWHGREARLGSASQPHGFVCLFVCLSDCLCACGRAVFGSGAVAIFGWQRLRICWHPAVFTWWLLCSFLFSLCRVTLCLLACRVLVLFVNVCVYCHSINQSVNQ